MSHLRAIPAVEKILQALGDQIALPRPTIVATVRRELSALRTEKLVLEFDAILDRIRASLDHLQCRRLQPVINGSGVIVHTNLGRSPLGLRVVASLSEIAANYNTLEYDLSLGERGGRAPYLEHNLALLCGAEAATVVNNCAAALVLIVRHFAKKKSTVVISRGELVQIGGGFRIGEILEASGARLREVGATNKTTIEDYTQACRPDTAMILKVHRSNFFMSGFVELPATEEIATLARTKRIPFIEDLGSGAVVATEQLGLVDHEPTPAETLKRGADLVCFSGDKLLGGPQAGIIAGKARFISALKREPFFRALRCDKLILAALEATVDLHLRNEIPEIPILALLRLPNEELQQRAGALVERLRGLPLIASIGKGKAQIGGGALPRSTIDSVTLDLFSERFTPNELIAQLRKGAPPVIGYIARDLAKLDLRTIFPAQDEQVVEAIRAIFR
jgi:L-seryl-tRNA(Ser) seleniumtransferase